MESVYSAGLPPLSSHGYNPGSISGLPKQFVNSMRTLFDILDDDNAGLVPLSEIERRWRDDAVPNLPGVLDSLRSVAPPDGLLTFEIFVWGLRSALARARQCRELGKVNINHSFKNALRIDQEPVLPPYYYQSRDKSKQFGTKMNNAFRQKPTQNEALRSGSYNASKYNPHHPITWQDQNDVTFGRHPMRNNKQINFQNPNDINYRSRSSGNRPGHRRSNSGPITTAAVLPSPQKSSWPHNDYNSYNKYDVKMGLATKFSAERSPENLSDKENSAVDVIKKKMAADESMTSLKSDPCSSSVGSSASPVSSVGSGNNRSRDKSDDAAHDDVTSQLSSKSDLDNVTANTLFINADGKSSLSKPIGLSGKYIGLTGTMQRTKSAGMITSQYGSLRRPAMSTPNTMIASASENNFGSVTYERRRHNGARNHKKDAGFSAQRRQYASAGESGDESHARIFPQHHHRGSSGERKRSAGHERSKERAAPDGSGRRCNSASPPELPVHKSARSSANQELDDRKESTPRPKSTGPELQHNPRQLDLPPPSARRNSGKATSPTGSQKPNEEHNNPGTYATMGRRKGGNNKRRDPRRHTVANGIDYNMIKCIKQLEQEKDVILQGIDALDRGKEWFARRLNDVQDRQMRLSNAGAKSEGQENNLGLSQDEIDNLLTKISKMQRLVQSMTQQNVEISPIKSSNKESSPGVVSALRDQNHILTSEVSRQTDKINQLEREKSVLVQQLFQAKAEAQCVDGQVNTSIFI